ncbi:hypothetical protein [Hymenobacter psychrotolerans]|uniref:Uncharacterized protein n=1 Tax=Hymenobacter psychrotolerans DSM 18569 TaxID=1121959 RepID=A0A1M6RJA0_9BACT|nr:hypothetical protein [Hymenobacter psychrotolerans]SHK32496.1 hypothetical protein SAMN02746009_00725 [Hymenobacter psychrotolerans DSM 18569]
MNEKKTGLENFVERHLADFDAFEPRPDLWDDIEQKLAAPTAGAAIEQEEEAAPLRIVQLHPTADTPPAAAPAARWAGWLPRPKMAAALAGLLLAGAGAIWSNQAARSTAWTSSTAPLVLAAPATEPTEETTSYGFGAAPVAAAAEAPAARLSQEVRRMEGYYAVQINERQAELQQLEARTASAAGTTADWQRELAALDSTYRQLKTELYRNPEPAVVLDAMNRNLQIRLDILNQQTRTQEQIQEYHAQPQAGAETQPTP